jgi:hypothetical protein
MKMFASRIVVLVSCFPPAWSLFSAGGKVDDIAGRRERVSAVSNPIPGGTKPRVIRHTLINTIKVKSACAAENER